MTKNELDPTVRRCFMRLCHETATPFAYKMLRHLKNEQWVDLCASAPRPGDYTDTRTYQMDAVVGNFFKKYRDWDLGDDLNAKAIKSFFDNEISCYWTNERLSTYIHRGESPNDVSVRCLINNVRKNVKAILGKIPNTVAGRFGPGSTFGDIGQYSTLPDKMNSLPTVTTGAYDIFNPLWEETSWARLGCNRSAAFPEYVSRSPEFIKGNRWTSVPKDALKKRGICIEPSINLFYQLGIGGFIRQQLKNVDIDILVLQARHRQLAQKASIDGSLATIDLSNASDTISKNLVKLLLPSEWYQLLCSLRSPSTFIDGKWVRLEKFSSMGNGYTFELETLLFFCIAQAVSEMRGNPWFFSSRGWKGHGADVCISVYGDDIIVPTNLAEDVISALSFFGMTTNKDKTFITGPFRESCGGDYFLGVDVRPHFLKESPNEPQQLITLANGIARCGRNSISPRGRNNPYHRAWLSCVDGLPTVIRTCKGPESLGDIVIHQEWSEWSKNRRTRGSIHYIRCYRPVRPVRIGWENFHPGVVLASAVYGAGDGAVGAEDIRRKTFDLGGVFPRQSTSSYKIGWVAQS